MPSGRLKIRDIARELDTKAVVPAGAASTLSPGRSRSRILKKLLESRSVIPAIKHPETGRITRGLPGETHFHVIEREAKRRGIPPDDLKKIDDVIDEFFKPKKGDVPFFERNPSTGFADPRSGRYLSRVDAGKRLDSSAGESQFLFAKESKAPLADRLAKTRRGREDMDEGKLFRKRKQAGKILQKLNKQIRGAASGTSLKSLPLLLNRRGVVRGLARKIRYLGVAGAISDTINNISDNLEE